MKPDTPKGLFCVISGPSGSGKTTICRQVAQQLGWYYSVSYTTRPKRENEIDGVDYFFVDNNTFQSMIAQSEFLEWARVYNNHYGTSRRIITDKLAAAQGVIVDADTQGASAIKQLMPEAILIFITPPDLSALKKRLVLRGRDTPDEIAHRLDMAKAEMANRSNYDHVVLNASLDKAIGEIVQILRDHQNTASVS